MKPIKTLAIAAITLIATACGSKDKTEMNSLPVIPYPAEVDITPGHYDTSNGFNVSTTDSVLNPEALKLTARLTQRGFESTCEKTPVVDKGIILSVNDTLPSEGYTLAVNNNTIKIAGSTPAGVFYGIQTLLQIIDNSDVIPCMEVYDYPRYSWRGYMRDDARHFTGVESVKQLLDLMAYYKLNRFHWHLTDAQGWRVEIKKYPKLATVGGCGSHSDPDAPVAYYTQDQFRDIVNYATERHIVIIPEIDMPGHATAANRAYPEYNGGGAGIFPDFTFNPGKESTYRFLTDILAEVADIFPGPYMHIGGDEVAYGIEAWKTNPHVKNLMKREGMTDVRQAERYFMNRMIGEVGHLGKTLVGWDELIDLGVDTTTCIMWWRHDKPEYLTRSLDANYTTIMCPRKPLYLDFVQHERDTVGRIWDGFCPLDSIYAFPEPWFENIGVSPQQQSHIIGMQANAWSELLHNSDRVDYMTWPRLCAVAESAWTLPENKDYAGFVTRLDDAYMLLDSLDIYYFDHRDPARHAEPAGPVIKKKSRENETNYRD